MFFESLEPRRFLSHSRIAPPAAPSDLVATPDGGGPIIRLTWTDNSSKQSGVIVQAKKGRGAWTTLATLPAQSAYYRAAHLQAGAVYAFRVASFNRGGDSAMAAEATALSWAPGEAVVDSSFGVAGDRLAGSLNSASPVAVSPDGATLYLATSTPDTNADSQPILLAIPTSGDGTANFGDGGEINVNAALSPYTMKSIAGIAVQPDGKILIAGNTGGFNNSPEIARFNPDGSLDTTFAGTGEMVTNVSNIDQEASGLALAPNGQIYVGGTADDGTWLFATRVNSDGTVDQTYGDHGTVQGDQQNKLTGESYQFYDASVAFDPSDNSAVVAANYALLDRNGYPGRFTIMGAHLLPNDTFADDFTYSDAATTFGPGESSVIVDSSGKIVVVGSDGSGGMALRFNADGTRDTSWVGPGTVVDPTNIAGPVASFTGIAQLPDHSYVVVGDLQGNGYSALIGHLTASGALVAGFTQRNAAGNIYNFYSSVALSPDGSIFAAGESYQVATADSLLVSKFSIAS